MPLASDIRFQKTLATAAAASNENEAAAAEFAARRLMETFNIDPTDIPDQSLYNRMNFGNNELLKKLRAEWREAHPVVVLDVPELVIPSMPDFGPIQFNINGFTKHAYRNNRKKKRKSSNSPARLTRDDHERIRQLLNEGWELKDVAELTGYKNVNSTRAWFIRSKQWVKDRKGHWQWSHDQAPAPTKPQPTEENAEQNELTSVP